jgi:putative ABC transport system permease protein
VSAAYAEQIASIPGVNRAAGVLLETLSLEEEGVYGIPTMGISPNSWLMQDYELQTHIGVGVAKPGDQEDITASQNDTETEPPIAKQRTLMLGANLAERVAIGVGGTVQVFDEAYRVEAIFKSPSTWENGSMIFPLEVLQELTDRAGQVTYINVVLDGNVDAAEAERVIEDIQAIDSKLLPLATAEFVETDTRMQLAGAMAWMTSMIALVIGTIGTLNTMLTSVLERTKEIGILRAIGWPKRRVVWMIVMESCGVACVASVLGCLLAIVMTWSLSQAPAVKGVLSPAIDVRIMAQGFVLAILIGLLGAILPAWRAAKLLPTEAFREN